MYIVLAAILGLFTGSFLNVCIDRLPRGESIAFPPSHCESCDHKLGVLDLIPVFSYLFLRGSCRYCKVHIPIRLMIVELVTGVLFGFFFWKYGFTLELLVFVIYSSILIIIFAVRPYEVIIIVDSALVLFVRLRHFKAFTVDNIHKGLVMRRILSQKRHVPCRHVMIFDVFPVRICKMAGRHPDLCCKVVHH